MRAERALIVIAAGAIQLVAMKASGQQEYGRCRGIRQFDHVGTRVVGVGGLLTAFQDSSALALVGSTGLWITATGGQTMVVAAPTGSTSAFGADAAVIRGFSASGFDAAAVGDPGHGGARGRVSIYLGSANFASTP